MKNQVTTIEQSRRLLELGVPAEKASMGWGTTRYCVYEGDKPVWKWRRHDLIIGHYDTTCHVNYKIIPAFTVADLLGILPNCISNDDGITINHYYLTLSRGELNWEAFYEDVIGVDELIRAGEIGGIIPTLICLIEWLLSNGYKLEG